MRIVSFRVQGFKSIVDTGVVKLTGNILVLAGQNEAGKSAILEALTYFSQGPSEDYERLEKRSDVPTSVECTFELSDSDIAHIAKEVADKPDLHKYLEEHREVPLIRKVDPESPEKDHILQVPQPYVNEVGQFFYKEPEEGGTKTWPGLTEFTAILKGDVVRTQIAYDDDSLSNLLPGQIKASEIETDRAVKDFEEVFGINFKEAVTKDGREVAALEQRVNKSATDDLNKYWSQRLDVGTQYQFQVKINRNETAPLESTIEFMVQSHDQGHPLYLEQKSKGFRWFSAFNLRLRALGVNESHPEDVLLLIDEPGEGLHERAQTDLKTVIEELAAKGATVIYATHNPLLIGTQGDELSRIRIVVNETKLGTKAYTLPQYASKPGVGSQDSLSPLITALGLHSLESLRTGRQNKLSVVVEGITDHYYYRAFSKLSGYEGAYFLPAVGASNVPNLVSVLLGWGEQHKVIFDDDPAGRREYNTMLKKLFADDTVAANKVLHKIKGAPGVEELLSGADFRKYVLGDESKKAAALANVENAAGSKEVLARLFYDKIVAGGIKLEDLDKTSQKNIDAVIKWLQEPLS